ncbi:hypothetical protein [Bradyrhizobium sp. B117]|uniref:hypothetical protein n=1 Tax=Bradyrhizobium sp. B117 TaxID=3140246 RepID=UPI0031842DF3
MQHELGIDDFRTQQREECPETLDTDKTGPECKKAEQSCSVADFRNGQEMQGCETEPEDEAHLADPQGDAGQAQLRCCPKHEAKRKKGTTDHCTALLL